MTTAQILAFVEAQIRKDIPRTMELREGCLVKEEITDYFYKIYRVSDFHYNLYRVFDNDKWNVSKQFYNKYKPFKIIGHEIMLNDFLEWFSLYVGKDGYGSDVSFGQYRNLMFSMHYVGEPYFYSYWDLSKLYFKDQSEELIKFSYNLISQ